MRNLNRYEKEIVRCLHKYGRPMSINEIAKRTGLGWGTVEQYIRTLYNDEYVFPLGKKIKKWVLNY